MSASIHRLTAAGPVIEPEASVIEKLKELLALAEGGRMKSFGYFYVNAVDGVSSGWESGCASSHHMVCGAAKLAHRVLAAATDG